MSERYAAIPTRYAGVQFRSRTEARWAALFDLLRWTWEYEPFDLDGYIPDFVVEGRLMVEVKADLELAALHQQIPTAGRAWVGVGQHEDHWRTPGRSAVIVGGRAHHRCPDSPSGACIGVCFEPDVDASWTWCTTCNRPTLFTHIMEWSCWLCGDGGHKDLLRPPDDLIPTLDLAWREAGNRVQWRSPVQPGRPGSHK